jgi:drug/metabolite transporter (DMT)-like permease
MMQSEPIETFDAVMTRGARAWFRGVYLYIAINSLLVAGGQLLMKQGATATAEIPVPSWLGWLGVTALGSWWVWAGILCQILGFLVWLHLLRLIPLSIAYSMTSVVYALVPVGAWAFLGESIGALRGCGIGLIVVGIWVISGARTRAEESL